MSHKEKSMNLKVFQKIEDKLENLSNKFEPLASRYTNIAFILYVILCIVPIFSFLALCLLLFDIAYLFDPIADILFASVVFPIVSAIAFITYIIFPKSLYNKQILRYFLSYEYWVVVLPTIITYSLICYKGINITNHVVYSEIFICCSLIFWIGSVAWICKSYSDSNDIIAIKQIVLQIICSAIAVTELFTVGFLKLFNLSDYSNWVSIIYALILLTYMIGSPILQIFVIIKKSIKQEVA